jgi:hypothetical protein
MTAIASPERGGQQPAGAGRPATPTASPRADLEALAFLVALFGILLVVVVTIGTTSPFGP